MSTNSSIGIMQADGTIRSIYVHWDGSLDGVGAILQEHYQDEAKIKRLLDLGDVSILQPSIDGAQGHSFDRPVRGQTVFYGRDRGEEDVDARTFTSVDQWSEWYTGAEYFYLRDSGMWSVRGYDSQGKEFVDLPGAIEYGL